MMAMLRRFSITTGSCWEKSGTHYRGWAMAPTSVVAGRLPLARPFHAFSMLWRPRSAGGGGHPGAAGPQPLDQLRQGAGPQLGVEAADALEPLPRQAERVAARAAAQA